MENIRQEPDGTVLLFSPMIGTFWAAQPPATAPLVAVGSWVRPETVACIVEGPHTLMNPILAEVEGEVLEVLARSGEMVDFCQPLFRIQPDTPGPAGRHIRNH